MIDGNPGVSRIQTVLWIPDRDAALRRSLRMRLDQVSEKNKERGNRKIMVNTMEKKPYITERVYVETPVDTDGDGKKDLIAVYLRLPRDLREGEKIPAIYIANPYMLTCNEDWYVPHDVNCEVQAFAAQDIKEADIRFDYEAYEAKVTAGPFTERKTMGFAEHAPIEAEPEFECVSDIYEYFNVRGYATVLCGGLGTRGSEGFDLDRFQRRGACVQICHRLAQRTLPRVYRQDAKYRNQSLLVQRKRGDDRKILPGYHVYRRSDYRCGRAEDHHSGGGDFQLVCVLPRRRTESSCYGLAG